LKSKNEELSFRDVISEAKMKSLIEEPDQEAGQREEMKCGGAGQTKSKEREERSNEHG